MRARRTLLLLAATLVLGGCDRDRLMREAKAAADRICECVQPSSTVDQLSACESETWKKYEAAEMALNEKKYDSGPEYAAVHARRIECQDSITRRQSELVERSTR